MEQLSLPRWMVFAVASLVLAAALPVGTNQCVGQPLTLYAGPSYDGVNGYINPSFHQDDSVARPQASWALLNNAGTATWQSSQVPSTDDYHALRFTPLGGPAVQLGDLAGHPVVARTSPYAINATGMIVGRSRDAKGRDQPVRWDAGGTTPKMLDPLEFFEPLGAPDGQANDVNDAGIAVGWHGKQNHVTIANQGNRAVRWNLAGEATELANISSYMVGTGEDASDVATAEAYAINNANVAVGYGNIYAATGVSRGHRAVRWDATGAATQLGDLGTSATSSTNSEAWAVNEGGDAVGFASKFDAQGLNDGQRAVRWNAGSTNAIELKVLGTDPQGVTVSKAFTLNEAGTAVGWVDKYNAAGAAQGARAVKWNAAGDVTELGLLAGANFSQAFDINESGLAAGAAGTTAAPRAVYWKADGSAVDLNTLIAPDTGWVLQRALAISDTGWIAGIGKFDDGFGGVTGTYDRVFMLQLPSTIALAGDYNNNGTVDAADYVEWRDNLGTTSTLPNDTTPGSVSQADYEVWREHFGATAAVAAGVEVVANAVPEPATIIWVVFVAALVPVYRRFANLGR